MKKTFLLLCLLAITAGVASAQFTNVSGTVTDTGGLPYSQASLTITLSLPTGAIGAYLNGAQIAGTAGPFKLDSNGAFLVRLADNTLIQCATPAGALITCAPQTTWLFTFTSIGIAPPVGTGPQTFSSTQTISGVSQTLTISTGPRQVSSTLGGAPGGSTGQVQFNSSGAFAGDPNLTWNTGGCTSCLWVHGSSGFQVGGNSTTTNPFLVRDASNTNLAFILTGTAIMTAGGFGTINNCSSSASPAVCGSAPDGSVVIAAAATTVQVNTSAVTANSQILLTRDDSLGTKLSVTCNTATVMGEMKVSARVGGTSFTITVQTAPAVNPGCISYSIVN